MGPKIVVVGAGIIGASIAWHLRRQGADVTVIGDRADSATAASFGWINASFHLDEDHYRLRAEGLAAWRRLRAALDLPVRECGCLCWETAGAAFDAQHAALAALGYPVEVLDGDGFAARAPGVAAAPERCLFFPTESVAEPAAVVDRLLTDVPVYAGLRVTRVLWQGAAARGVETTAGAIEADAVAVAAGTGTQALLAAEGIDLPLLPRPGLILRTAPVAPVLRHVLVGPHGELRQLPDGSLLLPTAVAHQSDASETPPDVTAAARDGMVRLRALLPGCPLRLAEARLAMRPVPRDGRPAMGMVAPGLYAAVMHSGITLGALAGELAAAEVLHGPSARTSGWLARYRPERFAA